jgi:hypothetical protein
VVRTLPCINQPTSRTIRVPAPTASTPCALTPLYISTTLHTSIMTKPAINLQDLEDQALFTPQYRLEAAIALLTAINEGRREGSSRSSNQGNWRTTGRNRTRSRTRDQQQKTRRPPSQKRKSSIARIPADQCDRETTPSMTWETSPTQLPVTVPAKAPEPPVVPTALQGASPTVLSGRSKQPVKQTTHPWVCRRARVRTSLDASPREPAPPHLR